MLNRLIIFLSLITFASAELFFSEYAEGSSNNKYLEIYNPTGETIALENYAFPNVSNAPAEPGMYEYWNTFDAGATIEPGDVYVICHGSSDVYILDRCDQTHTYLSNGDDGFALVKGTEDDFEAIDWIGDWEADPGSGWDVCGDGTTKDHTLVRDEFVTEGSDWFTSSAAETCQWKIYEQNTWEYLGYHEMSTGSSDHHIEAGMYYYLPGDLTIDMGETVYWTNVDGYHDVVAYDGTFEFPACQSPCEIGSYTFDQPGVYEYYCSVGNHEGQGMVGTIVVEGDIQLPCEDPLACNFLAYEDCTYPGEGECDCEGNVVDCAGECGGDAVVDDCGECGGENWSCSVNACVFVDMALAEVGEDGMKARTSTVNGEYSPSDWITMDQDGTVYSICLQMIAGNTYGYNFNNNIGSGYESGADLDGVCAGGTYGNDRIWEVPADATGELYADTVCWESCDACPDIIEGCTDESALNYDENATDDDGSCIYDWPEVANLFFSEYAEGSSNNKYLEIYNASDEEVDLEGYSLSSCSNGCNDGMNWDYPDNVTFEAHTWLEPGGLYVVCNPSADEYILAECDQEFTYLSNGDDVFALTQIGSGLTVDIIGVVGDDPGSGWDVDGVSNATKDHTLVRKSWVQSGNPLWLDNVDEYGNVVECGSAGGTFEECESEWIVLDQNDWTFLGSHEMDAGGGDCGAEGDINGDGVINILDIVVLVNAIVGDYVVDCGDLNGDGTINILDIVAIVNIITSARTADATSAMLNNDNLSVSLSADGYIGGVQMTLTHGNDFTIELTDNCMASNYVNHGNYTTLVVVEPHSELLFTANGTFDIKDLIVANSENEINVSMINEFSLGAAYPNPFNPSTSFDVSIPASGYLSIKVYDLSGKLVDTIANGIYNQSNYTFTWDASGMPSGMYMINAEFNNSSISHNISLIK